MGKQKARSREGAHCSHNFPSLKTELAACALLFVPIFLRAAREQEHVAAAFSCLCQHEVREKGWVRSPGKVLPWSRGSLPGAEPEQHRPPCSSPPRLK